MHAIEATEAKLKCLKMVDGTDLNWLDVIRVKSFHTNKFMYFNELEFSRSMAPYEIALGVVEGKPVWRGDKLYCNARNLIPICNPLGKDTKCWSWLPPAPKTVMIEMTVEDAKCWHESGTYIKTLCAIDEISVRFYDSVQKALNNI